MEHPLCTEPLLRPGETVVSRTNQFQALLFSFLRNCLGSHGQRRLEILPHYLFFPSHTSGTDNLDKMQLLYSILKMKGKQRKKSKNSMEGEIFIKLISIY